MILFSSATLLTGISFHEAIAQFFFVKNGHEQADKFVGLVPSNVLGLKNWANGLRLLSQMAVFPASYISNSTPNQLKGIYAKRQIAKSLAMSRQN
jgi:hypothetical protein